MIAVGLRRRLEALEGIGRIQPSAASDVSALTESQMLFLIDFYDRRIAGDAIAGDDLAEARRLEALIIRQPGSLAYRPNPDQVARVEEEFARAKRLGWFDGYRGERAA